MYQTRALLHLTHTQNTHKHTHTHMHTHEYTKSNTPHVNCDCPTVKVTPPEEPLPVLGVPCVSSSGGINPSSFGGSTLGLSSIDSQGVQGGSPSPLQVPQQYDDSSSQQSVRSGQSPQHLQGTIV